MRQAYTQKCPLTGSEGAGILTKAGNGGLPPLNAMFVIRAVVTDRRRRGVRDLEAMVATTRAMPIFFVSHAFLRLV
jgi:hypothetical protein